MASATVEVEAPLGAGVNSDLSQAARYLAAWASQTRRMEHVVGEGLVSVVRGCSGSVVDWSMYPGYMNRYMAGVGKHSEGAVAG